MQPLSLAATILQNICQVTVAKLHWMKKIRHKKALEKYQATYEKWQKDRTELLVWIAEQDRAKDMARHDFQTTDQALAFYNQTHRAKVVLSKEPQFSDFYKPSQQQKK